MLPLEKKKSHNMKTQTGSLKTQKLINGLPVLREQEIPRSHEMGSKIPPPLEKFDSHAVKAPVRGVLTQITAVIYS